MKLIDKIKIKIDKFVCYIQEKIMLLIGKVYLFFKWMSGKLWP